MLYLTVSLEVKLSVFINYFKWSPLVQEILKLSVKTAYNE